QVLVDDSLAEEIYNKIPDKKYDFKQLTKKNTGIYSMSRECDVQPEGAAWYCGENLAVYTKNSGGFLVVFRAFDQGKDVEFTKVYDYQGGKLTESAVKLPEVTARSLITDYLFVLGAEEKIPDDKVLGRIDNNGDIECYYDPSDGYEFEFDYAYGRKIFQWDGEKFVEKQTIKESLNYVSAEGLKGSWTVQGVLIGGKRPTAIKDYTIKNEKGEFVYYLNGEKRFSVKEDANGNIEKISVYTRELGLFNGMSRKEFDEDSWSNLTYSQVDGKTVATRMFENSNNIKNYIFDKPDGIVVQIDIIKGDDSIDEKILTDFYIAVMNAGEYSVFENNLDEMNIESGEGDCIHESRVGGGHYETFHFAGIKKGALYGALQYSDSVAVWKFENSKAVKLDLLPLPVYTLCAVFEKNADIIRQSKISYSITCSGELDVKITLPEYDEELYAQFTFNGKEWEKAEE
ncbi:MAG: hypothetical protein HUK20_03620, partial [Fibrobacter sp.]|nr:hypothetical protein [Fibrobacter sp.]